MRGWIKQNIFSNFKGLLESFRLIVFLSFFSQFVEAPFPNTISYLHARVAPPIDWERSQDQTSQNRKPRCHGVSKHNEKISLTCQCPHACLGKTPVHVTGDFKSIVQNRDENPRMRKIFNSKSPPKVRACADSRRDFRTTDFNS